MPQTDYRARLQPKPGGAADILGPNDTSNILYPLWSTRGVLFPYTPSLATGYAAEYDPSSFIHSIYGYNAYVRSYPKPLSLAAEFTAQTTEEALYMLAVISFFKSATKSYFGVNPYNKAGTPPPVLLFNYLGQHQYNNVPVIIKSFDFTYEANIDYVPVNTSGYSGSTDLPATSSNGYSYVPTHIKVQLEMDTQYIPIVLRDQFNLDLFRQGKLLDKGFI
jgi:hypothetical protein